MLYFRHSRISIQNLLMINNQSHLKQSKIHDRNHPSGNDLRWQPSSNHWSRINRQKNRPPKGIHRLWQAADYASRNRIPCVHILQFATRAAYTTARSMQLLLFSVISTERAPRHQRVLSNFKKRRKNSLKAPNRDSWGRRPFDKRSSLIDSIQSLTIESTTLVYRFD